MRHGSVTAGSASRRRMLTEAISVLVVSFLGWAVGGALVWGLGRGPLQDDAGLLVLAAVPWAVIPLGLLRFLRRRAGTPARVRPRTWGIWFVITAAAGSALVGIVRPYAVSWTSMEIWAAIFLFTPIGIALETTPRFVRPAGWTGIAAHTGRAVPLALLAAALGVFTLTTIASETPLPLGTEAGIVVGLLSLGAVLAFMAGLPMVAFGAIGVLFIGFSLLVQFTWIPVVDGVFIVDAGRLAFLHLIGGLSLVVATAVVQMFRRLDASAAETAIVDWLRAEAVLPERPAPERSTTG